MAKYSYSITLIGSGNIAWHLGKALKRKKHKINQVFSRNTESGSELALTLDADFTNSILDLDETSDIFLLAVPDKAIAELAQNWPKHLKNKLLAHTSGSVSLEAISDFQEKAGVFYPLQTFTKKEKLKFKKIPVCIEATNQETLNQLIELAQSISKDVRCLSSEQRRIAHLSAVFANNFTNYMFSIAADILKNHNLPFDLIQPLIKKTADKQRNNINPFNMQTGPAIRADLETMSKHIKMLSIQPDYQEIYKILSHSIQKQAKNKK